VKFTAKGEHIAKDIYRRHVICRDFLTNILNIDSKTADKDACRMEHAVSPVTLEKLVKFMEFVKACPRGGPDWLQYFHEYRQNGSVDGECLERMRDFAKECNKKIEELESKIK
jgi:DtxR family Mn-dependent transcriptional regulator